MTECFHTQKRPSQPGLEFKLIKEEVKMTSHQHCVVVCLFFFLVGKISGSAFLLVIIYTCLWEIIFIVKPIEWFWSWLDMESWKDLLMFSFDGGLHGSGHGIEAVYNRGSCLIPENFLLWKRNSVSHILKIKLEILKWGHKYSILNHQMYN